MKKQVVALALCCCMATPLVGCGGNKVKTEEGTINVMMVQTGWGTEWMEEAKEKFETLYAAEGYKVNLLPAKPTFQGTSALSEIRLGYEKTGYDVVISSGYSVQDVTDANYGVAVEPLTDVMNSQPINFDGSLGSDTIEGLYNDSQNWRIKIDDTYWGVPYSTTCRGIVCNMKVLNKFNITEMPTTSDELFEMYDTIYNGGMRPVVWGGGNAFGYALPVLYNTIAQLLGREEYEKFYSLDYLLNDDGTIKADGYNHVNNEAVKEAINVTMRAFDVVYSLPGSLTQEHDAAHASIAMGQTAFMFDLNSFFNEISTSFPSYLNDVRFCLMPIPTKLGVDLKLDGTGNDRAKCDDILSFMTKKIDEGKTAAEIKSSTEEKFFISLTDEQVSRVIEARTTGNGGDAFLNVVKGSPNAEISKLFIRMLLSEDAAKEIYVKHGMISPTYAHIDANSEYQFINDAYKNKKECDFYTTSQLYPGSVRANTNLFLIPPYTPNFIITFKDDMGPAEKPADRNYDALTNTIFTKVTDTVRSGWEGLMKQGGYSIG